MDDNCTKAGATAMAAGIRNFWRAQGFDVTMKVIPAEHANAAAFYVRSDMVDGLPVRRLA